MAKKSVEAKLMRHENPFVIFDIETGGLDCEKNPIVEIGAVAIDWNLNDLPDRNFVKIIKPYDDKLIYNQKALEVNGLSMADIEKGELFDEVMKGFAAYLDSFKKILGKKKPVIVGHNIQKFDIPWMVHCFKRVSLDFEDYFESYIDTISWSRYAHTEQLNFKLGTVCSVHGIQITNAHSALGDVIANKELFKIFMRSLRGEGSSQTVKKSTFREKFQF